MSNQLKNELSMLERELGTPAFDSRLDRIESMYTSDADRALISESVGRMLSGLGRELDDLNRKLDTLQAVKSISDMISFKYIAEKYFKKSKAWFSQRLNGNKVHGKICTFSEEELEILRFALQDISKKIGSLSI